jgi:aspartate/methionine/tyrosine aminotransferase
MKIDYLTWVKDLYRDFLSMESDKPFYNLTSSSVEVPIEKLKHHIELSLTEDALKHSDPWFHPGLTAKIARLEDVRPENILLTSGGSGAIFLVCRTILEKGDEVIVEHPYYEPLTAIPKYLGAEIRLLHRRPENDFRIDTDALQSLMSHRTKLIVLTNLHNPTGAYLTKESLMNILTVARKANDGVKIMVDEVYHRFVDQGVKPAANLDEAFISINSLSKVYGLFMLRCGWITACSDFIEKVRNVFVLLENIGSPVNEAIANTVVEHLDEYAVHSHSILFQNRKVLKEIIQPLLDDGILKGELPANGCIYFPELAGVNNVDGFIRKLMKKQHVYVAPGRFFGSSQHIRIGFGGNSANLKIGLERFVEEIQR